MKYELLYLFKGETLWGYEMPIGLNSLSKISV